MKPRKWEAEAEGDEKEEADDGEDEDAHEEEDGSDDDETYADGGRLEYQHVPLRSQHVAFFDRPREDDLQYQRILPRPVKQRYFKPTRQQFGGTVRPKTLRDLARRPFNAATMRSPRGEHLGYHTGLKEEIDPMARKMRPSEIYTAGMAQGGIAHKMAVGGAVTNDDLWERDGVT